MNSRATARYDDVDRAIVDRCQGGFPVTERPFDDAARALGTTESDLLARVERLLVERTLTRFGPLFDVERMGGRFTLAAMQVPAEDFDRVTAIVNAFPEVAHNYAREHALNMWFVVATETPAAVDDALARIEAAAGLEVLAFPKEREYFVGMNLGFAATRIAASQRTEARSDPAGRDARARAVPDVDDGGLPRPGRAALDRAIVGQLQAGLPLVTKPYDEVARRTGVDAATIRARIAEMLADGRIRRIGAVPNHYALGWRANGMSVWDVDDARVDELGMRVGALDHVTHCYRRPRRLPSWPYNLFAMVHGHDRDEVATKVAVIATMLGDAARAHDVLFSTRVLKKTGLRIAQESSVRACLRRPDV